MDKSLSADRLPPQNLEAESAVIGAVLLNNEIGLRVTDILRYTDFYKPANQHIFKIIGEYIADYKNVDLTILYDELRNRQELDLVGGAAYVSSLVDSVASSANAEYYAQIVKEKSLMRDLSIACHQILNDVYGDIPHNHPDREDMLARHAEEILEDAEKQIFQVAEKRARSDYSSIKDIVKDVFTKIEEWGDRKARYTGIPTGFVQLDDYTSGFQPTDLVIVAARPSVGKTTLSLNIMQHVALKEKKPVAFFSLEMSKNQVVQNMLCSVAGVDAHQLRRGMLPNESRSDLVKAAGKLSEAKIFIDEDIGSLMDLKLRARRLKSRENIELLVIDYLQLLRADRRRDNRQTEVADISRGLKLLAKDLQIPIIALSQLNRGVEDRGDSRPKLSDLRESGAIEQDADVVILLWRDFNEEVKFGENPPATVPAYLNLAKQRNGPVCPKIELEFVRNILRFGNAESRYGEEPVHVGEDEEDYPF